MTEANLTAAAMPAARAAEALDGLRQWLEAEAEFGETEITPEDTAACEAAAALFRALDEEGVSDAAALRDLVYDYRKQAAEMKLLRRQIQELTELRDGLARSLRRAKGEAEPPRARTDRPRPGKREGRP